MILSVAFPTWKVRGSNDGCFFRFTRKIFQNFEEFLFFLVPGPPFGTEKLAQTEFWYRKIENEQVLILTYETSTFFWGHLILQIFLVLHISCMFVS